MPRTLITGNTWSLREQFKCLGGIWHPDAKGWEMPDETLDEARAILAHYRHTLDKLPVSVCKNKLHYHHAKETDHA
jgi:hypothetical protein